MPGLVIRADTEDELSESQMWKLITAPTEHERNALLWDLGMDFEYQDTPDGDRQQTAFRKPKPSVNGNA